MIKASIYAQFLNSFSDHFRFTNSEIDFAKHDKIVWHNFVRRREAEMILSLFPKHKFKYALELGAGDGGQSITIAKYCEKLICTDIAKESYSWIGKKLLERNLPNVEYYLCDAHDLSMFDDESFDLIFSSNMLEHITNIFTCLSECKRVLQKEGIMLHTMPGRTWKTFFSILNLLKLRSPQIHGVSSSHLREWHEFGPKSWKRKFHKAGFNLLRVIPMPFYVGHGNSFIPVIKLGNLFHLSASFLYILTKSHKAK